MAGFMGTSTMGAFKIVVRRKCYSCGGSGKGRPPHGVGGAPDDCPSCDHGWNRATEDITLEELKMALGILDGRGPL
jgi:hypothetical protein